MGVTILWGSVFALAHFWLLRWICELPPSSIRLLGHSLVVMGVLPLWGAWGALAILITRLQDSLDLPPLASTPSDTGLADLAIVTLHSLFHAIPYVLVLAGSLAWILAVLGMDRADDTPLHHRFRNHHPAQGVVDTFT